MIADRWLKKYYKSEYYDEIEKILFVLISTFISLVLE